uniref:Uncharacterized protein n=1 Tax=Pseudomonas phage Cygsa01 TaxID=3138529 RepID=A0AAU6W4M7_9VIRU
MATIRKFKVVFTARQVGKSGPHKVKKRTVPALNKLEAEHILRKAMRKEGFEFGVILETTSGSYVFNAMVKHPDSTVFAEVKGKVAADTDADVPAAATALLQKEGYEVGSIYNIVDASDVVAKGSIPLKNFV